MERRVGRLPVQGEVRSLARVGDATARAGNRADHNRQHSELKLAILRHFIGRHDIVLWPNETGFGFTPAGNPVRYGLTGSADIIGLKHPGGRFVAIELKTGTARLSPAQRAFRAMVLRAGGLYIEARSVADVEHL